MQLAEVKNTGNYERETPPWLFDYLTNKYMSFNIDCAATDDSAKCGMFYSKDNSYLNPTYDYIEQTKPNAYLWLNPPYTRKLIPLFVKKFMEDCKVSNGVLLVPTTICSAPYFKYIGYTEKERRDNHVTIEFIQKRVRFIDENKKIMNSAPFASMAVVVDHRMDRYI